jgi:hypothetical protein
MQKVINGGCVKAKKTVALDVRGESRRIVVVQGVLVCS